MFRSSLRSEMDRIAVAVTGTTIVMLVWLIIIAGPDAHGAPFPTPTTTVARHVDEGNSAVA